MKEKATVLGKKLKQVNDRIQRCLSRAEEFFILVEQLEKEKININDLTDGRKFAVNGTGMSAQEIKDELSKLLERYNKLKKNIQAETSETSELRNIQNQLSCLHHALGDIYAYLCLQKLDTFLEMVQLCYKKDQRMSSTIEFVLHFADTVSDKKLQCKGSLNTQFTEIFEKFKELTIKGFEETVQPRKESVHKLCEIMTDFIYEYLNKGASPEEIIKKFKPFEKYFAPQILVDKKDWVIGYTINIIPHEELQDLNPIDFFNKLFKQFYNETTLFSRSKAALKEVLKKHNIMYEIPKTWHRYAGWDVPIVTDTKSILVIPDHKAYVQYIKQCSQREMLFMKAIELFLNQAQDTISICYKEKELKNQFEIREFVTQSIKQLENTKPENKVFKKTQHKSVTDIVNKTIEALKNLISNMPIYQEDLIRIVLNMEKSLESAKLELHPLKIDITDEMKIIQKIKFSKTLANAPLNPNKQKITEIRFENQRDEIDKKMEEIEKTISNLDKIPNLDLIKNVMNDFIDQYINFQGYIKGGATLKDLQNKLSGFEDYFVIEQENGEDNSERTKIIFNDENIMNKNPHDLLNELFKKFTIDTGAFGTGSRSIECLKRALKKQDVTFTEGNYGTTSSMTSLLWDKSAPVITDEKGKFKLFDYNKLEKRENPKFNI
ncbi:type IV secretion protein Dot [Legionella sainthelensi]|nr:type IV secretion protein Dot [Legionella sainthelensi]